METINTTQIVAEDFIKAGYNVATNKRNTLGLPIFTARGVGNAKPDLLVWDPEFENEIFSKDFIPRKISHIRAAFIELKTGDKFKDILNGIKQTTMYYRHFMTNKSIYSIHNRQIHNVDAFLLGTRWSRDGIIYNGDEKFQSFPLSHISERYNFLTYPFTMAVHSMQRTEQRHEKINLNKLEKPIARNKKIIETGIMISKTPIKDTEKISYEYYAWLGNRLFPLTAKSRIPQEYISTRVKILNICERIIYTETLNRKNEVLPRSQVLIEEDFKSIEIGEWVDVKIPLWLYKKKEKSFGLT